MEKVIFWKDQFSLNELNGRLIKVQCILQSILNKFSDLGIKINDISQLSGLVDNQRRLIDGKLEDFIFNQLYPETPAGIKRDIYRDMVELPNLEAVKGSFEPLQDYLGGMYISDIVNWNAYSCQAGTIEIIKGEREKIEANYQEFVETKVEGDRLTVVQDLCAALNKLIPFAADHPANYTVKGVTEFNESNGEFVPGRLFIKNGGIIFQQIIGNQKKAENLKSSPVDRQPANIAADTSDPDKGREFAKSRNPI